MQFGLEKQFGCVCHAGAVYVNLFGSSIADLYQMGCRAGILAGHAVKDKSVPGIFLLKEQLSSHDSFSFNLITEYLFNSYSPVINTYWVKMSISVLLKFPMLTYLDIWRWWLCLFALTEG